MIKIIQDFPNYSITTDGTITNLTTGRVKTHTLGKNGYYVVHLYHEGKCKREYVHRLLCKHFIDNPDNKRTVNHKDGNKTNNCLTNLEWATDQENIQHAYSTNLNYRNKKFDYGEYEEFLQQFMNGTSLTTIAEEQGVALATISENVKIVAIILDLSEEYMAELARQKSLRAKEAGTNKRVQITLLMLDKDTGEELKRFSSIAEAKEFLGKSSSGPISNTIAGRQKSGYGYIWKKI